MSHIVTILLLGLVFSIATTISSASISTTVNTPVVLPGFMKVNLEKS